MTTRQIEVFYSYSHLDEPLRKELEAHLGPLRRLDKIKAWHDRMIEAGTGWRKEIERHLNSADLILLLISADFINSDFCYTEELKRALEREANGECRVIPIIARPVDWAGLPFDVLQCLPRDAKAVVSSHWPIRDEAWLNVAQGIRAAVDKLAATPPKSKSAAPAFPPHLSFLQSPSIGFVCRHDAEGNEIVPQLRQWLAPGERPLVALHGAGGVGKTTLATEAVFVLAADCSQRVVWTGPERRVDFSLGTLLDEIATQLGQPDLRPLALAPKQEAVTALLAGAPALVVLDNFETVGDGKPKTEAEAEQHRCSEWLRTAPCAALLTSRDRIAGARNLSIPALNPAEADEFLAKLIESVQFPASFTAAVRTEICETAEANPLLMQWIVGQIDDARVPQTVLAELQRGEGSAAQRVFDGSFRLPQLGDDGRAVLLALALFVPDAAREMVAQVAGLGDDSARFDEAVTRLARLWLAKPKAGNQRLAVEGLTRRLALARLEHWPDETAFRQRFVAQMLAYAEAHAKTTPEDFAALELEKDSLLAAMDAAFAVEDWAGVMDLMGAINLDGVNGLLTMHGYWDDAIERGEQALQAATHAQAEQHVAVFAHNLGIMHQDRGELMEARRLYQQSLEIKKRLGNQSGIANTLHQLAMLAQDAGEVVEARRLYEQSLEIEERFGNQSGIAISLHQLGRLAEDAGEVAKARRLYQQSLEIKERLGDQSGIASTLHQLGVLAEDAGEVAEARRLYQQSLVIEERLGNQSGIAIPLHNLGRLAEDAGETDEAARLFRQALVIFERLGSPNAEIARESLARVEAEEEAPDA